MCGVMDVAEDGEDVQMYSRRHYDKKKATETTIEQILQRFLDDNWLNLVGSSDVATKQQVKIFVKKLLRRNNRRELFNDLVFDKCFNHFGRWALTKELMVQFFKMILPRLQKECDGD